MKQRKSNNDSSRELMITESKTMRNEYIGNEENYDVLDKIKAISYLTSDMVLSVEQVANYYEVSKKAIETVISRHRDELEADGITVLKGESLKEMKQESCLLHGEGNKLISNKAHSLIIVTKRALLRIGMLLTTSPIAKLVRNHLLNCEEELSEKKKKWLAQREAGIIDRKRMTSAIADYIKPTKRFVYSNYTNMIYKIVFGKDAKAMREERGFDKNEKLRDSFKDEELRLVDEAETIVTALVTLGFGYDYIKQQLQNKYIKQLS